MGGFHVRVRLFRCVSKALIVPEMALWRLSAVDGGGWLQANEKCFMAVTGVLVAKVSLDQFFSSCAFLILCRLQVR